MQHSGNEQVLRLSEARDELRAIDLTISREIQEPLRQAPQIDLERIRRMRDLVEPPR